MTLPFDYGKDKRSHQVWDTDSRDYFIDNLLSVEDLIDTNNFNIVTPTPSNTMGNKLVRRLDGIYTLYYTVTNVIPLLTTISYTLVDLEPILLDSLIQNQRFNILARSPTVNDGLLPAQVLNLQFTQQNDRKIFITSQANGPTPIPVLSTFIGSIDLLPRGSVEKLLVS